MVNFGDIAIKVFFAVKECVAEETLLSHQNTKSPISIAVDGFDSTIGSVLQQWVNYI